MLLHKIILLPSISGKLSIFLHSCRKSWPSFMRVETKKSEDLHFKRELNNHRLKIFEPTTAIP